MRTKHFLFVLLSALCLVTVWAQPFDADIRQTADYKQGQTWVPVLLRDTAAVSRTNLGLRATWLTNTNVITFRNAIGAGDVSEGGEPSFVGVTAETFNVQNIYDNGSAVQINMVDGYLAYSGRSMLEWANNTNYLLVNVPFSFYVASGWIQTNAPANTTNVNRWIEVRVGTNSYRMPLYQ